MKKVYEELSEKDPQPKQLARKKILNVLDSLISIFVVSPLVVGFWYETFVAFRSSFGQ